MIKILLFALNVFFISSCSVEKNPEITNAENCFSSLNFSIIKDHIQNVISISGMGKYYIEYPPDKSQINDGNKHPSKNPENVYDISYNDSLKRIIFKNDNNEFFFKQDEGLISRKQYSVAKQNLADNLFCYILDRSDKK